MSNYKEIRLYHADSSGEYEQFLLPELTKESEFKRFYVLLSAENVLAKERQSFLDSLYSNNEAEEANISKTFYAEYKQARIHLFEHIKQQNPDRDELLLLAKTQKLLDRFIFVCFCEDTDLLPQNIFRQVVQHAKQSFSFTENNIWTELQGLFRAIDQGYPARGINAFDGGLFAPDHELDPLTVGDSIFEELARITDYDFESDLSVNILGHIFEQSISDLEELKASIHGEQTDYKQGKRKKEGVFYTPEQITRYIVEQAVGGWLEEQKHVLGISQLQELTEDDYSAIRRTKSGFKYPKKIEQHVQFWEAYKAILMNIKVLDPACGSGAFLNQAFDFLYKEGQRVNEKLARFRQGQTEIFDLDKHILSNNLYGVDLNTESVEITKLSLWLKTANKNSQLTALDNNIRSGNSLITNELVVEEKALVWEKEFPDIMVNGGFDVIIGNPPYVQSHAMSASHKEYFYSQYQTAEYQLNTFGLFVERSINLLKSGAFYGLIIPNYWLSTKYDEKLRQFVFLQNHAFEVLNTFNIFDSASVDTVILLGKKTEATQFPKTTHIKSISNSLKSIEDRLKAIQTKTWTFSRERSFAGEQDETQITFEDKIVLTGTYQLADFVELKKGMQPYEKGKGTPPQTRDMMTKKVYHATAQSDETYLPLLKARNIKRYLVIWENDWIKYGANLAAPRSKILFEGERILIRRILSGEKIEGTYLSETYINNTDLINIVPKPNLMSIHLKVLAAIILSKLCSQILKRENVNLNRNTFPKINVGTLKTFPIPEISEVQQQPFIEKVDLILELNQQLYEGRNQFLRFIESGYTPKKVSNALKKFYTLSFADFIAELKKQKVSLSKSDEFELMGLFEKQQKTLVGIKDAIDRTDREIDTMVYQLYELTDEQIQMVEGS